MVYQHKYVLLLPWQCVCVFLKAFYLLRSLYELVQSLSLVAYSIDVGGACQAEEYSVVSVP